LDQGQRRWLRGFPNLFLNFINVIAQARRGFGRRDFLNRPPRTGIDPTKPKRPKRAGLISLESGQ
jgi:hypothetical protein